VSLNNGFASHHPESRPSWAVAVTPDGRYLTAAEWKAERLRSITATDLPVICGLTGSRVKLYYHKQGDWPQEDPETEQMWWGRYLEDGIRQRWCTNTGETIPDDQRQVFMRHPDFEWLAATLDALTVDGEPREWKATGLWGQDEEERGFKFDTDNPPAKWIVQAHGQMLVTGCDEVRFGVFYGPELALKECSVKRNHDLAHYLLDLASDFRQAVIEHRQPVDFVAGDDRVLSVVYNRRTTGPALDWTNDAELTESCRKFAEAKEAKKVWTKAYEVSRATLLSALKDSTRAIAPGYLVTRSVAKNMATTVDVKLTDSTPQITATDIAA
jgi:predicted phage-related endonuclease